MRATAEVMIWATTDRSDIGHLDNTGVGIKYGIRLTVLRRDCEDYWRRPEPGGARTPALNRTGGGRRPFQDRRLPPQTRRTRMKPTRSIRASLAAVMAAVV